MPYKSNRRFKKKRTYRRKRTYRKKSTVPTSLTTRTPLGNTFFTKLKWYHTFQLDPGLGGIIGLHTLHINDLYNPSETSLAEHQALGFDQMMLFYNKFTVVSAKATASFMSDSSTSVDDSYTCGMSLVPKGQTGQAYPVGYIEAGNTVFKHEQVALVGRTQLVKTYSMKKYHGLSNVKDNGAYSGTASASPEKGTDLHIWVGSFDQASNLGQLDCSVLVEYNVLFHDPNKLTPS